MDSLSPQITFPITEVNRLFKNIFIVSKRSWKTKMNPSDKEIIIKGTEFASTKTNCRSSPAEVFLGKGILKKSSKFTGEHPCWSAISIKLKIYWNCTSAWVFSCTFAANFLNTFPWKHLWRAASVIDESECYILYHLFRERRVGRRL